MSTPQVQIKHNVGNTISVPNQIDVRAFTYTSTNTTIGATALPVDNAVDFTSGTIVLLLENIGIENAEIVVASGHTNQNFTVAATLLAHLRGGIVQQLNYDQIVVSKASTINGTYAVLATQTFQVTQQNTVIYDATGLTTDYYKIQWRNSQSGTLSEYSEAMSVDSYPVHSVASVINPVLIAMGVSKDDSKINAEFCISAIDDARKFTQANLYGIRHAWQQAFEHPIKCLSGTNYVNLPDDIDFNETDRSTLAARFLIGNVLTPYNLRYIDKRSWNQIAFSVLGGETTGDILSGAVSIQLTSTGDFPASGVAYVATDDFTQTLLEIEYTANDLATNTLTGVTGVTRNIPEGTQIWQRPTIAQPIYYTVFENKLVFDRIIPDSMQGTNIYIDYYKKIDEVTSLYQVLPEPYREIYKWYLRYAVKYRKDLSLSNDDPDLVKFESLVKALFNNLYTGQDTTVITS